MERKITKIIITLKWGIIVAILYCGIKSTYNKDINIPKITQHSIGKARGALDNILRQRFVPRLWHIM